MWTAKKRTSLEVSEAALGRMRACRDREIRRPYGPLRAISSRRRLYFWILQMYSMRTILIDTGGSRVEAVDVVEPDCDCDVAAGRTGSAS